MIIGFNCKYYLSSKVTSVFTRAISTDFKMRFRKGESNDNKNEGGAISEDQVMRKFTSNYLLNLPHDVDGTHLVPILPGRYKTELFMKARNLNEDLFTEKFNEMIKRLYISIANRDYNTIFALTEKRFGENIKSASEEIAKNGINLEFKSNNTPLKEQKKEDRSYIFDKMFEKGVYIDRDKNDNNYDYNLDVEYESEGLRHFKHKFFLGYEHHYYFDRYDGKDKSDENNSRYKYRFLMDHRNRTIVFRIYGVIRNIGRFTSSTYNGEKGNGIYPQSYSGNHLVVFENQIIEPPIISLTSPNVDEWIKRHKINNNEWKISDIDNYMRGNKFFNKIMDQSEFKIFADKYRDRKDFFEDRVNFTHNFN